MFYAQFYKDGQRCLGTDGALIFHYKRTKGNITRIRHAAFIHAVQLRHLKQFDYFDIMYCTKDNFYNEAQHKTIKTVQL